LIVIEILLYNGSFSLYIFSNSIKIYAKEIFSVIMLDWFKNSFEC